MIYLYGKRKTKGKHNRRFKTRRKGFLMSIILTKKQEQGLKVAVDRYLSGEKYTVISGYA